MKELSIEEKARRYDEAKYIMKEYLELGNAGVIAENTIRKAFPELAESEDEKIRKEIIEQINLLKSATLSDLKDKQFNSWLAWLEKQGEKPADSYCQENCKGFQETGKCFADGECKAKREAEQKTAWSEEDENAIQVLKNIVRHSNEIDENIYTNPLKEKLYDWLNSIRDRIQSKQEWSEEDENNINSIVSRLEVDISYWESRSKTRTNEDKKLINWLKSLRPQKQWMPSKEQMVALNNAILLNEDHYNGAVLSTLREQLKKLMEE